LYHHAGDVTKQAGQIVEIILYYFIHLPISK